MDGWKDYEGKEVFVKLRNHRQYSGRILKVEDKKTCTIIFLLDKFKNKIGFYATEIEVIEEQGVRAK